MSYALAVFADWTCERPLQCCTTSSTFAGRAPYTLHFMCYLRCTAMLVTCFCYVRCLDICIMACLALHAVDNKHPDLTNCGRKHTHVIFYVNLCMKAVVRAHIRQVHLYAHSIRQLFRKRRMCGVPWIGFGSTQRQQAHLCVVPACVRHATMWNQTRSSHYCNDCVRND